VLLTGRIGSTRPNIALGFELEVITMVVLGGVSIAGGSGGIVGVTLAVFVLGLTTFGLSLVNTPGIVINILNGALLIVSIAAPNLVARVLRRKT
jgi:rhamnose transport system permease protein